MSPLPDYQAALDAALRAARPIGRLESIGLQAASGRVLATDITADRDLPPFNRAQMDGFALRAAEIGERSHWTVSHVIAAGISADVQVPPGHCVAIATGAPLPDDVDTVIQHELSDSGPHARVGDDVRFSADAITRGHAVHPKAADARAGQVLIRPGTLLAAHHLGIAAAVGAGHVDVAARPRCCVLTSGDEVVPADSPAQTYQIRNSNGPMVGSLLERFGAVMLGCDHLADEAARTVNAVAEAIASHDLVVTVGGVSAARDHFPIAFRSADVQPALAGASIQPGRPIFVGRAPNGAVVVGLPGNPVSALVCSCLFILPLVRVMLGQAPELPWRMVELAEDVKPNPHRRAFRPAMLDSDGRATVPSWAGSGDLVHTSPTHGIVELPVQEEHVKGGSRLRFLPWP